MQIKKKFSGVIDFAVTKFGDYKVDFLGEYQSILKKALTRLSEGKIDC
jgi:hypothetical protein